MASRRPLVLDSNNQLSELVGGDSLAVGQGVLDTSAATALRTYVFLDASGTVVLAESQNIFTTTQYLERESGNALWSFSTYSNTSSHSNRIYTYRYRGTKASPTAVLNGNRLLEINAYGYDGANTNTKSFGLMVQAVEDFDSTHHKVKLLLDFATDSSPSSVTLLEMENGSVVIRASLDLDGNDLTSCNVFADGLSLQNAVFDASALTAARSVALPDKSGTIAFLDDVGGGGSTSWSVVSANTTMAAGTPYSVDATAADRTMTVAATIAVGDEFTVHCYTNGDATKKVSVVPNTGQTIRGVGGTITTSDTLDLIDGETVKMIARTTSVLEIV